MLHDCSSSIDGVVFLFSNMTSYFQDGDHDVISRRKMLLSGECTYSVCPAHPPTVLRSSLISVPFSQFFSQSWKLLKCIGSIKITLTLQYKLKATKLLAVGTLPQVTLGKLSAFPVPPGWWERMCFHPKSPPLLSAPGFSFSPSIVPHNYVESCWTRSHGALLHPMFTMLTNQ